MKKNTNNRSQRYKTLADRFWEKADKTGDCWLWTSAIGSHGYGIFWIGCGRSEYAHRVAYKLAKDEIPPGLLVMHSCDNPRCVKPDHLSVGTNRDNLMDASIKGRIARGERNKGGGKLTAQSVAEIKRLLLAGEMGCWRIAKRYGVAHTTIKSIRRGRIWRHIQL